ncbi:MAG: FAD-dependent oxidoreductase [Candidatus Obscuribacterales bacterium]|nr:FAD-dependent oxidoreductase [Candidatus Obscuribacterales bacterium]
MADISDSTKRNFSVVDPLKVNIENPHSAVISFEMPEQVERLQCDLLVVGGGMGGVSAALSALRAAHEIRYASAQPLVILTEETDWLGGQMTSQGVSALDENHLVEISGAARSYQKFRNEIRARYKSEFKLVQWANDEPWLNPGDCWVSWLAFEPKFALDEIEKLLNPYESSRQLSKRLRTKAVYARTEISAADSTQKKITSVGFYDFARSKVFEVEAKVVIDATELGDLLPMAGLKYRSGAESKAETGEAHAPEIARPENVQDFTYPFVIEYRPGTNNVIEKPQHYEQFNAAGKFSLEGYPMFACKLKGEGDDMRIDKLPFWEYRRLISSKLFESGEYPFDVAMINWNSNDLRMQNIIDVEANTQAERLALAKALSLGFLYWLQTEAPRDDGGFGYPEFYLRTDVLGSSDGLSKYPYIRESRRIVAQHTIVEEEIVAASNPDARAHLFSDSVGIGRYPVDIHGEQDVPGAAQHTKPFQIPLGALIPKDAANLLPACKNIGTTHVTNGSYRLHPIEWSIGEAQGVAAVLSLKNSLAPCNLPASKELVRQLQEILIDRGVPLFWFNDVPTDRPDFAAIQKLAIFGNATLDSETLAFRPDSPASRQLLNKGAVARNK